MYYAFLLIGFMFKVPEIKLNGQLLSQISVIINTKLYDVTVLSSNMLLVNISVQIMYTLSMAANTYAYTYHLSDVSQGSKNSATRHFLDT